jgi:hypothetical protein
MKVQEIISELNKQFVCFAKYQSNRQEQLNIFHKQFKAEEKKIHKKLEKQSNKNSRKKLKKELGIVKQAYVMLDA